MQKEFLQKRERFCHQLLYTMTANCTKQDWTFDCIPSDAQAVFCVLCATFGISLILNIYGMVICILGKIKQQRERRCLHEMQNNPIYGNLDQMETSAGLYKPIHMSLSSISSKNPQEVRSDSQDCYANLHLKAKKQNKRSPPRNQDPEVVPLGEPESVSEGNGDSVKTNAVSAVSDLYASVHNQRSHKAFNAAAAGEEFDYHI